MNIMKGVYSFLLQADSLLSELKRWLDCGYIELIIACCSLLPTLQFKVWYSSNYLPAWVPAWPVREQWCYCFIEDLIDLLLLICSANICLHFTSILCDYNHASGGPEQIFLALSGWKENVYVNPPGETTNGAHKLQSMSHVRMLYIMTAAANFMYSLMCACVLCQELSSDYR